MAHFVFKDPFYSHDGTDLSDHVLAVNIEYDADEVEDTHAGDTTHLFLPGGLLNYTVTVELAQDLASSQVDATLFPDVGTAKTVILRNINSGGVGATNPNYTGSMVLQSYPPIAASIGEKAVTKAVYIAAGPLSRATS